MEETRLFALSIFVGVVGLLVAAGLAYVGWRVFRLEMDRTLDRWMERWVMHEPMRVDPTIVTSAIEEYLSRRNEFWTVIGQLSVSILVVTVLTILLLTRAISAEAGLPILAGVGGFTIGKGVQTSRAPALGPFRREQ